MFGNIFKVYYDPEHLCWIQEGTSFYYDIDDWAEGVIKKIGWAMINKKEKKQGHQEINKDNKNNGIETIIVFIVAILFMSILSYAFLNLFIK